MARSFSAFLNDTLVGSLSEDDAGNVGWRFGESYRRRDPRPVLSQSFEDDLDRVYRPRDARHLPVYFANLLPEGRLKGILAKSVGVAEDDELGLLAAVGRDLPGALSLSAQPDSEARIDDATPEDYEDSKHEPRLSFSLAGVQLKFSLIEKKDRFALPARDSAGDWIVKIASSEYAGLVENEFAMLEWAARIGVAVPEKRILGHEQLEDIRSHFPAETNALALKRFDRDSGTSIHQEDFAQVLGFGPQRKYDSSYETLASVILALMGETEVLEFLKRLAFTVAIGNNDGHLKNWSIVYPDGMTPTLAPMYDQVATVAWPGMDLTLALKFAGARDFGRVSLGSFLRLAKKLDLDVGICEGVVSSTLGSLAKTWSDVAALLPEGHRAAILEHWKRVPLLRESGYTL